MASLPRVAGIWEMLGLFLKLVLRNQYEPALTPHSPLCSTCFEFRFLQPMCPCIALLVAGDRGEWAVLQEP